MKKLINFILPKEKKLFEMLAEESEIVFQEARDLKDFINGYPKLERSGRKSGVQSIKRLEHKADELTQNIVNRLDKSFSMPIDKEHIYKIASLLEEISDLISDAALKFVVLSIERIDDYMIKLAGMVCSITEELNHSIANLKKPQALGEHCKKMYSLENEADDIYHEALSELFHFYKNSVDIIKYREIYGLLEEAINRCRDIADVMHRIDAKRS